MTDHRPTLARFDLEQRAASGLKTMFCRNYKSISPAAICWAINAEALSKVFFLDNVGSIHSVIVEGITDALDLVAPLQRVQVKERRSPLYLSNETRSVMRERDSAAARGNLHEYRRLRNKSARLVRRDRLASNLRHLQEQGFNPKSVWHLANSASGRSQGAALPAELQDEVSGQLVVGDDKLADCVNAFYIDKIIKIRAGIDAGGGHQTHGQQQQQQRQQLRGQQWQRQFKFRAPSEREVLSVIKSLNNTSAIGIDGIPVSVLKSLAPIIAAPISHLVRRSFESAIVPSGFKKASVLPLHKKNKPPHLPSSYRPVSILVAMSKIMERVVLQQVSPHLANLLPPTQFGFRPKRSTAAAIAYAHGSWAGARARGLHVAVAGYDLSSAFDTIDVDMLSTKLEDFGILGKERAWFQDYLSGRSQRVVYNGSKSSFRPVKYGVPQGSILGPLLFLVLVADLPDRILGGVSGSGSGSNVEVGFSAYADDALCWVAGKNTEQVASKLEQLSAIIVSYASQNYLAINEKKTQVLWTTPKGPSIKVGSSTVDPANRLEILGVSFDTSLTPIPHLASLISSTRAMTAAARRLSLHLPPASLKMVMAALYRGKIGYGCLVLHPRFNPSDPTPTLMAQLQVSVNDLARAMVGAKRCDRLKVEDLLSEAGLISVNRLVIYSIAMECWRALSQRDVPDGPLNPLGLIMSCSNPNTNSTHSTRTRAAANGCLPPPTKVHVESFIWWAHICWNLSPPLRSAANVSAAKRAANELAASAPF